MSEQGKYDEAKSLYETATTTLTELYGEKDLRVLDATTGFGMTNWEIGNLYGAQKLLQSVLSRIKESSNTLGRIGRKAATTLTLIYWHLGLITEAEECQRRVLADIDSDTNLDIFSALEPRYTMGIIVQESGQWQAAGTIFSDLFTERVKLFGYTNRDVARTANALGRLLCFLGKYDRSRELLELAWKLQQNLKLDPMNLAVLRTLFNLAVLKREEGFYDESLEGIERAAALQLKRGEGTNSYLVVQIELAILKNACGQPEAAVAILEQVQKIQRVKTSPEHPDCIRARLALAQSYIQIGQLDLAEKALRSNEEISPKYFTADHPYRLKLQVTKAEISRLRGEYGNFVVDDLSGTISRLEQVLGNKHPETIYASFVLGQIYLEQGLEQQGRERIQWSMNTLKDCLGQNHPKVRELLNLEAASLARYRLIETDKGKENEKD